MTTIEKHAAQVSLPAGEGRPRLSVFVVWCRLLVCLAALAAAQQSIRSLRSPTAAAPQPTAAEPTVSQPTAPHPKAAEPTPAQRAAPRFMVDVNRAPQHELEALPEVGPSLAARIVDFRMGQGPFRHVDDLMRVRGFGPRTLEQLRPMLLVGLPHESPRVSRQNIDLYPTASDN